MKRIERLYFILTYTFFIYPPFILGLVNIYSPYDQNVHITVLIINLIVLLLLGIVCYLLILNKKLHPPKTEEIKYLLFGFTGNVVMYFYTFQNNLNIENIVTIYLVLLIVLFVFYLLISKKFRPLELWILLPIFLVYDYLFLALRGCGWASSYLCYVNNDYDFILSLLFWLIIAFVALYYIYKIVLYRLSDIFKWINISLVTVASFLFYDIYNIDDEIMLTIMILLPFFVIIDFIVKLVNKTYTHKMLLFYTRTTTLLIIFMILGTSNAYRTDLDVYFLSIFVTVTYISLFISVLKTLLSIEVVEENPLDIYKNFRSGPRIKEATTSHLEQIKEQYNDMLANHVKLDSNSYSLVIVKEEQIIGFISTYINELPDPLLGDKEAYINVIEIHTDYRNKGFATKLVQMTEAHFKSEGIKQIRAWSSEDKYEAINLWKKLRYGLSPATIFIEKSEVVVKGYYVVKKL